MNELYTDLKNSVAELQNDLTKNEKGNKSAGVRLRKQIKQIQAILKDLRSLSLKERE
jgi:hypothetical protein